MRLLLVLSLLLSTLVTIAVANSATTPLHTVRLGMSAATSGPNAELGSQLHLGASLYFNQVNSTQLLPGTQIEILLRDDSYEPNNTVANTRYFQQQAVDALFSYVGTPTTNAMLGLIEKERLPLFTPFTGADILRNGSSPVINLRASYHDEVELQAQYFIDRLQLRNVALLIQADEYGLSVERSLNQVLNQRKIQPHVISRYRRNSADIVDAVNQIVPHQPDVIFMVGTYQAMAEFIKQAKTQLPNSHFVNVSFVAPDMLKRLLPDASKVYSTQIVPPLTSKLAVVQQFLQLAQQAKIAKPSAIMLEGFLNAKLFTEVAKQCLPNINSTCLLAQGRQLKADLGGLSVDMTDLAQGGMNWVQLLALDSQQVLLSSSNGD